MKRPTHWSITTGPACRWLRSSPPPICAAPSEAREYVEELRAVLVATGASDGKMEEGSLRVDCNVSVRPQGSTELGTRCEIKNMNSLRSLVRAIAYEAARQVEVVSNGGAVVQETRHWDEADGRTHSMRSKEEAFDYRYFPEPDLVTLDPGPEWTDGVMASLPVLPAQRRARVAAAAGVDASAEAVATVVRLGLDEIVAAAVTAKVDPGLALRRLANEVAGELADADGPTDGNLDVDSFLRLVALEATWRADAGPSPDRIEGPGGRRRRPGFDRGWPGFPGDGGWRLSRRSWTRSSPPTLASGSATQGATTSWPAFSSAR